MKKPGIVLALVVLAIGALEIGAARAQERQGGVRQPIQCAPGTVCQVRRAARRPDRRAVRRPGPVKQAKVPGKKSADQKKPTQQRIPYTEHDRDGAVIAGMPGVRFFSDSVGAFLQAIPPENGPWLILSSGGATGAYGAGVLYGWSATGKRPEFSVVTGVSIGALLAPYAFLGQRYDDQLRDSFLTLTSADVFEDASRPDSLVDTWPLKELLTKRITPTLLADIAAEHRRGRRLFVVTTDLDAERAVVWDLGAIAAHGGDAALKLAREVLLAASAIPGVFPPVLIDAEANGRKFQEMHADGGVFGPFFIAPDSWMVEPIGEELPTKQLYVIVNSKLTPEFEMADREKVSILSRTISAALKAGARAELALVSAAAKRDGIELNVSYVDSSFHATARTAFDQDYMKALFDLGVARGKDGTAFRTQTPAPSSGQAHTK
jgi:hypothetical protein